jgi:hypothetical protein
MPNLIAQGFRGRLHLISLLQHYLPLELVVTLPKLSLNPLRTARMQHLFFQQLMLHRQAVASQLINLVTQGSRGKQHLVFLLQYYLPLQRVVA